MHDHLFAAQIARPQAPAFPLADSIASLGSRIADWLATSAEYYAAAAIYEQLCRRSDAELQRRGLSRASLARDICQACDHATSEIS
jgi:hypothetical protein